MNKIVLTTLAWICQALEIAQIQQEIPTLYVKHVHDAEYCDKQNAEAQRRERRSVEYYYFSQEACACLFNIDALETRIYP